MKATTWVALVVAVLVVLGLRAADPAPKPAAKASKAPPSPVRAEGEDIVDGYGETSEKARAQALERARERIRRELEVRLRGWSPAEEQLDLDYLDRFKVIQESGKPEPAPIHGEKMMVARYRVELTSDYLQEVVRSARQEKIHERHLLLARVLGGILTVVLVIAGYLRMEESTRGYATKMLRLVAVLILAVVGVGLLVIGN